MKTSLTVEDTRWRTLVYYLLLTFCVITFSFQVKGQDTFLTKAEVQADLEYLDEFIQQYSSYQGLNGYDYKIDIENYLEAIKSDKVDINDLGVFLTRVIGQIGDRHAYIRGYELPGTKFFPMAFAPLEGKVLVLGIDKDVRQYKVWNKAYPFLKSIEGIPIQDLLSRAIPKDVKAPKDAFFTRAVRDLRDIEEIFSIIGQEISNPLTMTLVNKEGKDKTVTVELVDRDQRYNKWDEKRYRQFARLDEEDFNRPEILDQLFSLEDQIGHIYLPAMFAKEDAPALFERLDQFMEKAKSSKALIIDVRSNGGGVRDLIWELAGYFVHPDSIHVVNLARQRGEIPLTEDWVEDLHNRYLYARSELDKDEQDKVHEFNASFTPMYEVSDSKFSENYYAIFNGKKLSKGNYHYDKAVYVLANERSFSAASILVALFKGLPNIKIVGVTTDGSSGNSERFRLPHSDLNGKISTMISFQKDGQVLDGIGTQPDIRIERNLEQIQWTKDYQLEHLKEIIKQNLKH